MCFCYLYGKVNFNINEKQTQWSTLFESSLNYKKHTSASRIQINGSKSIQLSSNPGWLGSSNALDGWPLTRATDGVHVISQPVQRPATSYGSWLQYPFSLEWIRQWCALWFNLYELNELYVCAICRFRWFSRWKFGPSQVTLVKTLQVLHY